MNIPHQTITEALLANAGGQPFVSLWRPDEEPEIVTYSFDEFLALARSFARLYLDRGIKSGDTIILIMSSGVSVMAAFAGGLLLGAVPTILAFPTFKVDPEKYRLGLAGVTRNLSARLVVIDSEFPKHLLSEIAMHPSTELLEAPTEFAAADRPLPEVDTAPDKVAFIQHSAGTTGLQKGVALTHRAVLNQLRHLSTSLELSTDDRIISWLPLYHDMGLIACFVLPMVCRLHVVMQSPTDWVMRPSSMLQLASTYRCSLGWMPNFSFQMLAKRVDPDEPARLNLKAMKGIINCSEPVRFQSMNAFAETYAVSGFPPTATQASYAMAENTFAVTQSALARPAKTIWVDRNRFLTDRIVVEVSPATPNVLPLTSSGTCLDNNWVRILDENGRPHPNGFVGDVVIRSDSMFDGYYNRPDLTAKVLADGWYSTRDVGFVVDGELFVIGRRDDTIITSGRNVYPQDLEEIASQHPAIHSGRTVAFGLYSAELGTDEVAIVAEVNDEADLARRHTIEAEIRKAILADFGISTRCIHVVGPKWIIKSTAGKPARSSTKARFLAECPEFNSGV